MGKLLPKEEAGASQGGAWPPPPSFVCPPPEPLLRLSIRAAKMHSAKKAKMPKMSPEFAAVDCGVVKPCTIRFPAASRGRALGVGLVLGLELDRGLALSEAVGEEEEVEVAVAVAVPVAESVAADAVAVALAEAVEVAELEGEPVEVGEREGTGVLVEHAEDDPVGLPECVLASKSVTVGTGEVPNVAVGTVVAVEVGLGEGGYEGVGRDVEDAVVVPDTVSELQAVAKALPVNAAEEDPDSEGAPVPEGETLGEGLSQELRVAREEVVRVAAPVTLFVWLAVGVKVGEDVLGAVALGDCEGGEVSRGKLEGVLWAERVGAPTPLL